MVTQVDVAGSIGKGLQVNQLRQQLEAQKAQQQERNALKSLYSERFGGTDPKTGITWDTGRQAPAAQGGGPALTNQQFAGRATAISPEAGMDWQKHFASQDTAALERDKAEAPLMVAAFENVQDQGSYEQARAMLQQRGVDVSDIPPQYDPRMTNMVVQGARYLAGGMPKEAAPSNVAKLIAERDALPQGDPRRATYDNAIAKATTHRAGTSVEVNTGPTGIDYGKPEAGLVWARNPDGTVKLDERGAPIGVPYQGGSVFREQQESAAEAEAAEAQAAEGKRTRDTTANIVIDDINRVEEMLDTSDIPVAGVIGGAVSQVPGTNAYNAARLLDTIRANVGFDKLQAMRDASPTGGALGQVSEMENRLLQATLGNLEQSQSPEQFRYNLNRVREAFLDVVHGPGNRPEQETGGGGQASDFSAMPPQELLTVDIDSLNAEQLKQLEAAMNEAGL